MVNIRSKILVVMILIVASLLIFNQSGLCSGMKAFHLTSGKTDAKHKNEAVQIPEHLDEQQINALIAGLDDDQVRRLLINELKKSAASSSEGEKTELSGFAGIIASTEELTTLLRQRLNEIRSGARSAPEHLPEALANLQGKGGPYSTLLMFAALLSLFIAGVAAEWLFGLYARKIRTRIESMAPANWWTRLKGSALCAGLHFGSICVFVIGSFIVFSIFYDKGEYSQFRRLIFLTFLASVLLVRVIVLVSVFVLEPRAARLRLLPVTDERASYLHRWIVTISVVVGVSLLMSAILQLQRVSQASRIAMDALAGFAVIVLIGFLLWQNRDRVALVISKRASERVGSETLLRVQIAEYWHLLAIPYLIVIWGVWVLYLLVGRAQLLFPILALMSALPLYILFDWAGQRALDATFGLVKTPEQTVTVGLESVEAEGDSGTTEATGEEKDKKAEVKIERFVPMIRKCLSFSIGGILFFWLLRMWGFNVQIGTEITHAAFKILVVVSLSYVGWKWIEAAINRQLTKVQPAALNDHEDEMGGAGGSRIATLLHLLRKFLMVVMMTLVVLIVLSDLGVNIGPLLAGAGVVGLAVGFGSQTLVKDIVAGIFFLIDDAFRLGDYVESGQVKGTVEHISIRSLRLRHPRGMVYTVPFGHLGSVTNFSRDYIILKIEFRVPYGTNINKIRKIVKKIDSAIEEDPEMGPKLLEPIKSQGVKALDDSGLIMRIKFKTRPGDQFTIRKEIYSRLQKAFEKNGIQFARRQVIVQMPEGQTAAAPAANDVDSASPPSANMQMLAAGGAAAIASALAEEEQQAEEAGKKSD